MIQYGNNGLVAVPPGEFIKEHLGYLGLENKEEQVARFLELSLNDYHDLLEGGYAIEPPLAGSLAELLGPAKGFWLAVEKEYQNNLSLIRAQNNI